MFTAGRSAGKINDFEIGQIEMLRKHCLPPIEQITQVLVGRAQSHQQLANLLGLGEKPMDHNTIWGIAGALVLDPQSHQVMFRCNGKYVKSLSDFGERLRGAMLSKEIQDGAVLCTSKEAAVALCIPLQKVEATTCYEITVVERWITYRIWSNTRKTWGMSM